MLETIGYEVVDLGRNVDCELIAAAAKEQNIKLVGLSALMTNTVPAMENIIKMIKSGKSDCKIMVAALLLQPITQST